MLRREGKPRGAEAHRVLGDAEMVVAAIDVAALACPFGADVDGEPADPRHLDEQKGEPRSQDQIQPQTDPPAHQSVW